MSTKKTVTDKDRIAELKAELAGVKAELNVVDEELARTKAAHASLANAFYELREEQVTLGSKLRSAEALAAHQNVIIGEQLNTIRVLTSIVSKYQEAA